MDTVCGVRNRRVVMVVEGKSGKRWISLFGGAEVAQGEPDEERDIFADRLNVWMRTLVGQSSDVQVDLEGVLRDLAEGLVFFRMDEQWRLLRYSLVSLWCATDKRVWSAHLNSGAEGAEGAQGAVRAFEPKLARHGMDVVLGFMVAGRGFESMVLKREGWGYGQGGVQVLGCGGFKGLGVPRGLVRELDVGGDIGSRELVVHEVPEGWTQEEVGELLGRFREELTLGSGDVERVLGEPVLWDAVKGLGVPEDLNMRVWLTADCWDNGVPMDGYLQMEVGWREGGPREFFAMRVEAGGELFEYFRGMVRTFYWNRVQVGLVENAVRRLGMGFEVNGNRNWVMGGDEWVWRFGNRGMVRVRVGGVREGALVLKTERRHDREGEEAAQITLERMEQIMGLVVGYYCEKARLALTC